MELVGGLLPLTIISWTVLKSSVIDSLCDFFRRDFLSDGATGGFFGITDGGLGIIRFGGICLGDFFKLLPWGIRIVEGSKFACWQRSFAQFLQLISMKWLWTLRWRSRICCLRSSLVQYRPSCNQTRILFKDWSTQTNNNWLINCQRESPSSVLALLALFPSGHSSKCYPRPMLLNFGERDANRCIQHGNNVAHVERFANSSWFPQWQLFR